MAIFVDGLFEVHAVDVGEGAEPGEDVAELLDLVVLVAAGQGGGQLADLLDKPEKGGGGAALAVAVFVHVANKLLEFLDGHNLTEFALCLMPVQIPTLFVFTDKFCHNGRYFIFIIRFGDGQELFM